MYLTFIETEREKELGMADNYPRGPIPFGNCLTRQYWDHPDELEIITIIFDYKGIVEHYNKVAKEQNKANQTNPWKLIKSTDRLQGIETRLACKNDYEPDHIIMMKESKTKPDIVMMEYKNFFRLLSHYLPLPVLRENADFVNWLRTNENLPY